jgi:GIY-YIG catalytic domain
MRRRIKEKQTRGLLLKGILENIPSDSFDILREDLRHLMHDKAGIYALYKDRKLYYVGLAKNLDGRVYGHLERDKHSGKWNKFSFFLVKRGRHLKDLETLVLRIAKPKGNKTSGKIPKHHEMRRALRRVANTFRRKADRIARALR